jgi:adhesin HecA-like repeat protein
MLVVEERNLLEDTNKGQFEIKGQTLYNSAGRGQGRGRGRFGSGKTNNSYQGRG